MGVTFMTKLKNLNDVLLGLTTEEVKRAQEKYGKNQLIAEKKENIFTKILEVLKEPMFILLLVTAMIYFILGEPRDGSIMLVFVVGIIGIDVIQEWKTDKTLKALKNLSAPQITVIRNGIEIIINSEDLVPGDVMVINEGVKIPADGKVIKASDLCVDESSLTGEAEGVWKCIDDSHNQDYWKKDYCYAGTLVTQGTGYIIVENIGASTEYGKIGMNVASAEENPTPLQRQTGKLVKVCAYIAVILCLLVCVVTYLNLESITFKDRIIKSLLSGVTVSMAMIPEEFPVILTVFLSMGAWRLAKKSSLVRRLPAVETLGAVSVLCVDKTGTITKNEMTVTEVWSMDNDEQDLIKIMGMACEIEAYDPMEQAMIRYCESNDIKKNELFDGRLVTEYAFTNERKSMGHVWEQCGVITIASKGSPENLMALCNLNKTEKEEIDKKIYDMSSEGLRVIAVAKAVIYEESDIPKELEDCELEFMGLIGLQDPPRETIKNDIRSCIKAGVRVVMITGDNGVTASAIAKQIGLPHSDEIITGDMITDMDDCELRERVKHVSIFSRVVPEHKMRIVKALKDNGEIVAMTGDGVNDAPALKYAHIGIAMGKRGSEVSREAADLILLDDNFSTIVDTIKDGRRIYDNIKKAIGYVFTIHIPIAFSSLLAPFLGIKLSDLLLLPLHVVLLEVIIDPTCSIVLERQMAEPDIMDRKPRNVKENILTTGLLLKSVIQGIVLFAASFGTYYFYLMDNPNEASVARSMGLAIIMISNLLLVQVNSSNKFYAYKSFKNLFKDKVMWTVVLSTIIGLVTILYTPLSKLLNLSALSFSQIGIVFIISICSIMWYELVKFYKFHINK